MKIQKCTSFSSYVKQVYWFSCEIDVELSSHLFVFPGGLGPTNFSSYTTSDSLLSYMLKCVYSNFFFLRDLLQCFEYCTDLVLLFLIFIIFIFGILSVISICPYFNRICQYGTYTDLSFQFEDIYFSILHVLVLLRLPFLLCGQFFCTGHRCPLRFSTI